MSMTPEERTEQTITEYGYRFYSNELRDLLIRQFRAAENDALERAAAAAQKWIDADVDDMRPGWQEPAWYSGFVDGADAVLKDIQALNHGGPA